MTTLILSIVVLLTKLMIRIDLANFVFRKSQAFAYSSEVVQVLTNNINSFPAKF